MRPDQQTASRLAALEDQQREVLAALQAQTKAVKGLQQALADAGKRERKLEATIEAQVRSKCHEDDPWEACS